MSLYKMLIVEAKEMVKLQRNFLWASWKNVCKLKEEGGLEMSEIRRFNIVLLRKWIW